MTLLAAVWILSVWAVLIMILGLAATVPLMHRRQPDPLDTPEAYGMAAEPITFPSRDGLTLGGHWIPAHREPARGTIVMCPGQNGSLDKDIPQATPLHEAGFNVLMFDFRGHARSEGEMVTLGALELADLFGALDFLEAEYQIAQAGVLGFSMGAGVALMAATQDDRIAALVVDGAYTRLVRILAGWMSLRGFPELLARGMAWLVLVMASLRTQYQLYHANPVDLAERITAPVLFIHGQRDPFVSDEEIELLAGRTAGITDLWRVPEAGHREAYNRHSEDYNRRIVAWFEQHLTEAAGASRRTSL